MSDRPPDFEELVGDLPDDAERARLVRVHELLLATPPPPALAALSAPVPGSAVHALPRRRALLAALAAAFGVVAFAIGFLAGERADDPGTFDVVAMSGAGAAGGAHAALEIFDLDAAGNWPMELRVTGLAPSASGRPYELWLTRAGKLSALCGSFLAELDGTTVVPLNAPYRLRDFDGWVVVEEGSEAPVLTT